MFLISKDHSFSASHQLGGLPPEHPCSRLHGHNYLIRIHLASDTLTQPGFVIDYNDLKPFFAWVDDKFDHQHLNERVRVNPSAENLARYLFDVAKGDFNLPVVQMSVSETPKTWATYTR